MRREHYIWIKALRDYAAQVNTNIRPRTAEVEAVDMTLDYLYEIEHELLIDIIQQIYFYMPFKKLKKGEIKNRILWYSTTYNMSYTSVCYSIHKSKKIFFEYLNMLKKGE